jgi:AbrB family looped-hinge helix DNA binding protein
MTTTLSSKGQIVVPSPYRQRLGLRAGTRFSCRVNEGSLVFTPETPHPASRNRIILDKATGLFITHGPSGAPKVTSEQIKALLADFP